MLLGAASECSASAPFRRDGGSSDGYVAGQADGFRDMTQVIVGEMVAVAT